MIRVILISIATSPFVILAILLSIFGREYTIKGFKSGWKQLTGKDGFDGP